MNSNKLVRTVVPPTHVTVYAGQRSNALSCLNADRDTSFILISSFSTSLLIRSQIAGSLFRISVPVESRSILVMRELIFYSKHK